MVVITRYLKLNTRGEGDILDITDEVSKYVKASGIDNGIVTIFIPGSTGALTTIEYEPGLLQDFPQMLNRIAPKDIHYEHDKRWGNKNGHSHVRASLIGPSLTVPFVNGRLMLGTWQQIVFIELDIRPRSREIILQIMGE
ncbi:MAG: secondary thiamine-phosphate synthase enzyme YjbQ [Nitrososphaerota archaeon]|nr:secondary thiamine-phosphate synthase enzyme YjbQ [Nitrososphaerales archaeon]MDW8045256.1 secondary thiamine-phosphate synthase enzyme YjbQ [Nitrososphaerota archaeon]